MRYLTNFRRKLPSANDKWAWVWHKLRPANHKLAWVKHKLAWVCRSRPWVSHSSAWVCRTKPSACHANRWACCSLLSANRSLLPVFSTNVSSGYKISPAHRSSSSLYRTFIPASRSILLLDHFSLY